MTALQTQPLAIAEGVAHLYIAGRESPHRPDEASCICCEGAHVFAATIDGADMSASGFIGDALIRNKTWIDGKRIRITVEVLDAADPA